MDTTAKRSFSGTDVGTLMRQLEVTLVPLNHRFRYPLPPPSHLNGKVLTLGASMREGGSPSTLAGRLGMSQRIPSTSKLLSDDPTSLSSKEAASEAQLQQVLTMAQQTISDGVPELFPWQERVQDGVAQAWSCYQILEHVLESIKSMQVVTESVQRQSDHLSHNASAMMVRKAKMELVQQCLEETLAHFTHMDDLCREAENPLLRAGTPQFSLLAEEIAKEMSFLSSNTQFKSAVSYATKLAVAQQKVNTCLKEAVRASFQSSASWTLQSKEFSEATHVKYSFSEAEDGEQETSPPSVSGSGGEDGSIALVVPSLTVNNVAEVFETFLERVNEVFVKAASDYTSLRRIVELRKGGFSYSGAEAFGEEMLQSRGVEADPGMVEILTSYCDARVTVLGPLLRYWLTVWYYMDLKTAENDTLKAEAVRQLNVYQSSTDKQQLFGVVEEHSLRELAEHICTLLRLSLIRETQVLDRMWLREELTTYLLPRLVSSIAEEVYYVFRSRLLRVDDVAELANTVESIQRVIVRSNADGEGTQDLTDLWVRMIQDTQERLVFRTSVHIRQVMPRYSPTREVAELYSRCGGDAYEGTSSHGEKAVQTAAMFFIPGVANALELLRLLYSTLEFSVFSVFAEEAIRCSLDHVSQLVKLMRAIKKGDALQDAKAYLCQFAHLLHLQCELAHIDANITVVEKTIDFKKLRQRRIELVQSSKESKKDVDRSLQLSSESVTAALTSVVAEPVTGAAKKPMGERVQLVAEMVHRAAKLQRLIKFYVQNSEMQRELTHHVQERVKELSTEVGVDILSPALCAAVEALQQPQSPSRLPPTSNETAKPAAELLTSAPANTTTMENDSSAGRTVEGTQPLSATTVSESGVRQRTECGSTGAPSTAPVAEDSPPRSILLFPPPPPSAAVGPTVVQDAANPFASCGSADII